MKNKGLLLLSATWALTSIMACANRTQSGLSESGAKNAQKIIGGTNVLSTEAIAKSVVMLYTADGQGPFCTGSIIAPNMILTAAHCAEVVEPGATARFGTHIPDRSTQSSDVQSRKIVGGKIHENWGGAKKRFVSSDGLVHLGWANTDGDQNYFAKEKEATGKDRTDMAILKLESDVPAGYVPATFLPAATALTQNEEVVIAGYGVLANDPEVIDPTDLLKTTVTIVEPLHGVAEVVFDQTHGHGACHGDSGGPAYVVDAKNNLLLFGVTSRGYNDPGDTCKGQAIYTNTQSYLPWIKKTIAGLNR